MPLVMATGVAAAANPENAVLLTIYNKLAEKEAGLIAQRAGMLPKVCGDVLGFKMWHAAGCLQCPVPRAPAAAISPYLSLLLPLAR